MEDKYTVDGEDNYERVKRETKQGLKREETENNGCFRVRKKAM
jgi:hypothetical protein